MSKAGFSVIDVSKKVASGVGAFSILFSVAPNGNVSAMFGFLGSIFNKDQENKQSENNTYERFENQDSNSYSKIYDNNYRKNNMALEKEKDEKEKENVPGFFEKVGNAFSSFFSKEQSNLQSENSTDERFKNQDSNSYSKVYNNNYGKNNIALEKEKDEEEKENAPGFFEEVKERFIGVKKGIGEVADKFTNKVKSVFTSGKKEQNENNFSNEEERQEDEDSYKNNKKRRYSDDELVENCKIEANNDENGELNFYKRDFNEEGKEIEKHKISYEKNVDNIDDYNGDSFNIISDNMKANNDSENMIIEKNDNNDNEYGKENENENEFCESQNMIIEENNNNGNTNIQEQGNFSLLNQGFSTPNE